jgi:hypothetical protein
MGARLDPGPPSKLGAIESLFTNFLPAFAALPVPIDQLQTIYNGFIRYLLDETCEQCRLQAPATGRLWVENPSSIVLVIAHPNGWEKTQKAVLHTAARANLNGRGSHNTFLVAEAEASLHFCISRLGLFSEMKAPAGGVLTRILKGMISSQASTNLVVCDAGGSTVDISVYRVDKEKPVQFSEVRIPACSWSSFTFSLTIYISSTIS